MSASKDRPPLAGSYRILTWGCQMNVHDSEKLAGALEGAGYRRAEGLDDADVILLNTCSIREKAAEKVFSELGRLYPLKQRNPRLVLGVCGCVAQQEEATIFERAPYVDLVIGPRATGRADRRDRAHPGQERVARRPARRHRVPAGSIRFPFDEIRREGLASGKAFVTVIEGCNHRCTYCIVPTTRGREVCREMDSVMDEVRSLVAQGIVEIEFLGQTVNAYRDGQGRTLADLLLASAAVPGLKRLRFTTSHPAQMTDRLMDAMAEAGPVVCPYLHLPAQSGSSAVLRAMRRGYDRERYLEKIAGLRSRIPEITFGTDLIVGYPTESEADFGETLSLLDEVGYDQVYSFAYSPRPGTAATADGDPLPLGLKLERLRRLQEHQRAIQSERMTRWVGREVEVLVEGRSKRDATRWTGRTLENRIVHFPGTSAPGRLERVLVQGATAFSLSGETIALSA